MFKFEVGQKVIDKITNKPVTIVGCIGQLYCMNAYHVRYDEDNEFGYVEWRNEEQIEATEE